MNGVLFITLTSAVQPLTSPIIPVSMSSLMAPLVARATVFVKPWLQELAKAAILGYDEELQQLLMALPGNPVCYQHH